MISTSTAIIALWVIWAGIELNLIRAFFEDRVDGEGPVLFGIIGFAVFLLLSCVIPVKEEKIDISELVVKTRVVAEEYQYNIVNHKEYNTITLVYMGKVGEEIKDSPSYMIKDYSLFGAELETEFEY